MRTTLKMMVMTAVAALGAGCGALDAPPGSGGAALYHNAPSPDENLPSCTAMVRPEGDLSVEDVPGTVRMIVRLGSGATSVALCAGTLDHVTGLLEAKPGFGPAPRASSDPMPADGRHEADSDPMPADGRRPPADSDPMPAHDRRPHTDLAAHEPTNPQ